MPSFQDSAIIVILALLLFGPKGMAKLARELGKLMGEFRRASADFRFQMEEEFRASEQAEQQKKIAAMEAAAPVAPVFQPDIPEPEHPHAAHFSKAEPEPRIGAEIAPAAENHIDRRQDASEPAEPLPIASSGNTHLMPPATGLPQPRNNGARATSAFFDSIPHAPEAEAAAAASSGGTAVAEETPTHG